jgi:hypothetical protein
MKTTLGLAGFLMVAALGAAGQQRHDTVCDRVGPAAIPPTDSVYADVQALMHDLRAHGVDVRCAYHTTMAGLMGEWAAVGFGMDSGGGFDAFFFRTPAAQERVRISERVERRRVPCPPAHDTTWYSYEIHNAPKRVELGGGYQRVRFIRDGRRIIQVWDARLAARIEEALRNRAAIRS